METKKLVKITQEHIRASERKDATMAGLCPIERAIYDMNQFAWVGAYIYGNGYAMHDLPPEAKNFVYSFDHGLSYGPFEVELCLVEKEEEI